MKMMTMSCSMGNNNAITTSSYEADASAHRLLAREGLGFDSADLGRRARENNNLCYSTWRQKCTKIASSVRVLGKPLHFF